MINRKKMRYRTILWEYRTPNVNGTHSLPTQQTNYGCCNRFFASIIQHKNNWTLYYNAELVRNKIQKNLIWERNERFYRSSCSKSWHEAMLPSWFLFFLCSTTQKKSWNIWVVVYSARMFSWKNKSGISKTTLEKKSFLNYPEWSLTHITWWIYGTKLVMKCGLQSRKQWTALYRKRLKQ